MMVCESLCGQFEPALPLAAAFQFMVTAADVFDDIEDGDCRSSFSGRCGFAVAVNAATALMLIAEQAISQLEKRGLDSSTTIKIYQAFNNHYALACCGQHLDLSLSINSGLDEEAYLQMVSMKSASQIECACHTGALAGKADSNLINLFRAFGRNLGMAAQMNNDLSGILTGKDIVRGKITMPVIFSLQQASEGVREQLLAYYLSPSGKAVAEVDAIKQLLFDCGANYYTLLQQEYYRLKAREALEKIQKEALPVSHLESFVS
jgi:geranylgeranyl pyrophosphate synthase